MKKNKMLRIASVLLVAVMMSTCAISGTFAKYVTSDSARDSARVAKFGVTVVASGSLFEDQYTGTGSAITVKTSNELLDGTTKRVAPGTSNTTGMSFDVSGTPEVAVKLDVVVTDGYKEVFLAKKNGYPDMTTGNATDTFNNEVVDGYYPVKFTLTQTKDSTTTTLVDGGRLTAVETALEGLTTTYEPGKDLAKQVGTLTLTWEWAFGNAGYDAGFDKHDTLLGDLAAGIALSPDPSPALVNGVDYNLTTNFEITITVTQID